MSTRSMRRAAMCAVPLAAAAAIAGAPAAMADPPAPACKSGFVWRAARPDVQPGGGNVCKPGFVWRNAYSGDAVCVTPDVRDQAAADNAAAASRTVTAGGPCQKWRGVTDELILAEDNGYKVFVYPSLTGQASFEDHGGPEVKGNIITPGGMKGESFGFTVNWSNGWQSMYTGRIYPDGSARGSYEDFGPPDAGVHRGNWDSVGKFVCDQ